MTSPPTTTCSNCGTALVPGDRFCGSCGTTVPVTSVTCTTCGERVPVGVRFCPRCGVVVAASDGFAGEQRTPTTVGVVHGAWEPVLERLKQATLGEFDIRRELGRGGMAAVYLAHEIALNRKVALKIMSPALLTGAGMIERFRQEAVTVANLSHAHIVTIHAVRQIDDLNFFVMKFIEGRSLEHVIRDVGTLPLNVTRVILHHVGSALAYAHRRGVVHRDIKPANILLDADGDAVVTDFGIAKVAETPSHTQTGTVVGTPAYMSPEQCYAAELTGASDQYSLGIVAYEMLTGRTPFSGSSFAIMQAHTANPVIQVRLHRPDCPPELDAAVLRMLNKSPVDRFANLGDALTALGAFVPGPNDPVREQLVALADVAKRTMQLGELLRTPVSPVPRSRAPRASGESARTTIPGTSAVAIAPPPTELEPGETVLLRASVRGSGTASGQSPQLTWSSSAREVATVDANTGVLTAISPGVTTITASTGTVDDTTTVRVGTARVATVRIAPVGAAVSAGDVLQLSAATLDRQGAPTPRPVHWSVDDKTVASISPTGALTLRRRGTVTVTAECDGASDRVQLTVNDASVARLAVSAAPTRVFAGDSFSLSATAIDAAGAELPDRHQSWSSSDPAVATVSSEGSVTARAAGRATIAVRSEKVTASVEVVVLAAESATVSLSVPPTGLRPGQQFLLVATARDVRGHVVDTPIQWRSSKTNVATVSAEGAVEVHAPGEADIVAQTGKVKGSVRISVQPAAVGGVASPPKPSRRVPPWAWIALGVTGLAAVIVVYEKSSSDPKGDVGRPPVIDSGKPLSPAAPKVHITPVSAPVVVGQSVTLGATATRADGSSSAASGVSWRSLDPATLTIDAGTGHAVAKSEGTAIVVARLGEAADSLELAIAHADAPGAPTLAIGPVVSHTLAAGEIVRLRAELKGPDGRPLSAPIHWTSNNPRVATVGARTGEVTGVFSGDVSITAASGNATASVAFHVAASAVTVGSVELNDVGPMTVGQTHRATAVVRDAKGAVLRGARAVFSSARPEIVAVDSETGVMTARAAGSTALRASAGGFTTERNVTVQAPRPTASGDPPVNPRAKTDSAPSLRTAKNPAELRAELDDVIYLFFAAVQTRDTSRIHRAFPGIDREGLRSWQALFDEAPDLTAKVESVQPLDQLREEPGSHARVKVTHRVAYTGKTSRKKETQTNTFEFSLDRLAQGWKIASIR